MPMRKRKWFIPVVVLSILLIGGIAGGLIAAADDSSSNTESQSRATDRYQALLDRTYAIYEEQTGVAIDSEQLKDALKQARGEMRHEALENWLQNLVDNGKITQEEADQYLEWWQSRPDVELPLQGLGRLGRYLQIRIGPWCAPDASNEVGG
jgi:uncharacterized membrane protein